MNSSQPVTHSGRGISGTEKAMILLLLLLGGVGAFLARMKLDALTTELESVNRTAEVAANRPATEAEGDDSEGVAPASGSTSAPPAGATFPVQNPTQLRLEALQVLEELIDGQVINLTPTGVVISRPSFLLGMNPDIPAYVVDHAGNLSPNFAEFFGLSENEAATLQSVAHSVSEQIDREARANATITETGPDAYEITIPSAVDAETLRAQFISTFQSVLGEARYHLFARLSGETDSETVMQRIRENPTLPPEMIVAMQEAAARSGPSSFFNAFGAEATTITFAKAGSGIRYAIRRGEGGSGGGGTIFGGASNPMIAQFESEYGPAIDLLPADFWE